eukprot:TRINITY_DN18703_c0_g1_i1.p1 TRINITY_DN18703_c0_g1~~TRINITY_DN18703_c0_g1_i1.p1  ORF type:complete len:238 (+),score=73.61 TRINITY_DN18703_c0_g1_i1:42-755(+)
MTAPSRLDRFGVDMRRLPGVVGLAHFTFALQRQEEVLVRVRGDGRHRVAAAQTLHAVEDGHAPSSPASSPVVAAPWDGSDGMEFLVAVYKKYDRPMAWCRTRVAAHEFALSAVPAWSRGNTGAHAKRPVSNWDYPLRLPAVERWPSDSSVNVGDVLCDLATAVLSPPPANPLRVDYAALPPASSDPKAHLAHLMAVAALLAVLSSATPTDDVMADVGRLHEMYALALERLPEGMRGA